MYNYIHSWHEVTESNELSRKEKWNYMTALRGPDFLARGDTAYMAKDLFTCMVRGHTEDILAFSGIGAFLDFFNCRSLKSGGCQEVWGEFQDFWDGILQIYGGVHWVNHTRMALKVLAKFYHLRGDRVMSALLLELTEDMKQNSGAEILAQIIQIYQELTKRTKVPGL